MFEKPQVSRWDIGSFTLPDIRSTEHNGWTVVHHFDNRAPIISLRLLVTGGTQQAPKGGLTHLTDSVLLHHLQKHWRQHLLSGNLRHGIQERHSIFSLDGLVSEWAQMCRTIATLFHPPPLDLEYAQHLRQVRIEEIEHEAHNPQSLASWATLEVLYPTSEMSTGAYGSIRSLNNINEDDIMNSLKRFQCPSGIVIVTGDVPLHSVLDWVSKDLPKGQQPPISRTYPRVQPNVHFVTTPSTHSQTVIQSLYRASNEPEHLLANELLSLSLGDLFTSRLNQNLRVKHGLTYGVSSSVWDIYNHPLLLIQTMVDKLQQRLALTIIEETMSQAHQGWTTEDLNIAKRHLCHQLLSHTSTSHDLANLLYQWLSSDSTLDEFNAIAQQIKEMSLETIRSAAKSISAEKGTHILVGSEAEPTWKLCCVQKMRS